MQEYTLYYLLHAQPKMVVENYLKNQNMHSIFFYWMAFLLKLRLHTEENVAQFDWIWKKKNERTNEKKIFKNDFWCTKHVEHYTHR